MGNKPLYTPEEIHNALHNKQISENEKIWDFICGEIYDSSLFDLRLNQLRENQSENFITLVRKATQFLHSIYADINRTPESWVRAMNCVRLLTRLVPVAFDQPEEKIYESALLQKLTTNEMPRGVYPVDSTSEKEESSKEKEVKGELGLEENLQSEEAQQVSPKKKNKLAVELDKPCIFLLLDVLIRMLFLPGFTIVSVDKKPLAEGAPNSNAVLDSVTFTSTYAMDLQKSDILLCIIACVSAPLFDQSHQNENDRLGVYSPNSNQYIDYLVRKNPQEAESDFSQYLLVYLLQNCITYDPIGWGVPYNHVMAVDVKEQLMDRSIQLLCLILEYRIEGERDEAFGAFSDSLSESTGSVFTGAKLFQFNIFSRYIKSLKSRQDFSTLYTTICNKLTNPISNSHTYLPGSGKVIGAVQEYVILFWHLIKINSKFVAWMNSDVDLRNILYPLLHYLNDSRLEPTRFGLARMILYIFYFLSKEREFANQLSKPIDKRIYTSLPGVHLLNYADFTYAVLSNVILESNDKLVSLYEYTLYIMSNTSAFVNSLSKSSALRLMKLFNYFSRPSWILASEFNYKYSFVILELLNNILQYQYSGNHNVVYSLISNEEVFSKYMRLRVKEEVKESKLDGAKDSTGMQKDSSDAIEFKDIELKDSADIPWVATNDWMVDWQQKAPIQTILQFLDSILPKIFGLVKKNARDERLIYDYLSQNTAVGLLPLPHQIIIRPFAPQPRVFHYIGEYAWGVIFLRSLHGKVFTGLDIRLFRVSSARSANETTTSTPTTTPTHTTTL